MSADGVQHHKTASLHAVQSERMETSDEGGPDLASRII